MPRPRKLPDDATLKALLDAGVPYVNIARQYDTTVAAVSQHAARLGYDPKVIPYSSVLPWTVAEEHQDHGAARMLRAFGRLSVDGELPVGEYRRLVSWLGKLRQRDEVVAYSRAEGFTYVPRRPEDGQGLIRKPI